MGMCRNPKLWIGVGVAALVIGLATSSISTALPLLLIAACPLSMVLMAGGMVGMAHRRNSTSGDADDEMARLRAEVEELREHAAR